MKEENPNEKQAHYERGDGRPDGRFSRSLRRFRFQHC